MKHLVLTLTALFALNANATGGFSCSYDDGQTKLEVVGVTSHGFEGHIISAGAELNGETFARGDFMQYWNNDGEFRLALYKETDTETSIVRIKTKSVDDVEFKGTVFIRQGGWSKEAEITCGLE